MYNKATWAHAICATRPSPSTLAIRPKNYNVKIVILEVYAFLVLQCTVPGRKSKHKTDVTA